MEDKVEQAGCAAVLFKHLLNPVKELSGKIEVPLITSTPAAAQVVREDELHATDWNLPTTHLASVSIVGWNPTSKGLWRRASSCSGRTQPRIEQNRILCFPQSMLWWSGVCCFKTYKKRLSTTQKSTTILHCSLREIVMNLLATSLVPFHTTDLWGLSTYLLCVWTLLSR